MSEHTKEPWTVHEEEDVGYREISIPEISRILHSTEWASEEEYKRDIANARRIVACVNRCAGISTEDLELGKVSISQGNVPHGSNATGEYVIPLTPERHELETPE